MAERASSADEDDEQIEDDKQAFIKRKNSESQKTITSV
jgi:hypothetical protein